MKDGATTDYEIRQPASQFTSQPPNLAGSMEIPHGEANIDNAPPQANISNLSLSPQAASTIANLPLPPNPQADPTSNPVSYTHLTLPTIYSV